MSDVTPERREVLLVEYQKAQDSAEHHDRLVGSVTSLNWLGSAVLIGFVLSGISGKRVHEFKPAFIMLASLGVLLTLLTTWWAWEGGETKRKKYKRCQEIEALLEMQQHRRTQRGKHLQKYAYLVLMGLFLATWCVLLAYVASR